MSSSTIGCAASAGSMRRLHVEGDTRGPAIGNHQPRDHDRGRSGTIFAYLTDAERLTRWVGVSATIEARPGGIYLVDMGNSNVARGEFREVVPVSHLAYSWGWERGPQTARWRVADRNRSHPAQRRHAGAHDP